jgi:hypothetical protein
MALIGSSEEITVITSVEADRPHRDVAPVLAEPRREWTFSSECGSTRRYLDGTVDRIITFFVLVCCRRLTKVVY